MKTELVFYGLIKTNGIAFKKKVSIFRHTIQFPTHSKQANWSLKRMMLNDMKSPLANYSRAAIFSF